MLRLARAEKYGPEGLTAGPEIGSAKKIIVVEGRADVTNLLRAGIQNVIALEGAKIPETIIKLCREKEATAFLDGDRGGDLILKELKQVTKVKYVARAPRGKEVEDLSFAEIEKALKERVPLEKTRAKKEQRRKKLVPKQIAETAKKLGGTLEAVLLNKEMKKVDKLPVRELAAKLQKIENIDTVVFDGIITQRLIDIAAERKINYLVAARVSKTIKQPLRVKLLSFEEIQA
jgi:DNA primase